MIRTSLLRSIVKVAFLMVVVSFYLFPIGFRGLPESLNSKQMLAVLGVVIWVLRGVGNRTVAFSKQVFTVFVISVIFSIWCLFSCTVNNTGDYSYATYFLSFFVWICGAYAVCSLMSACHSPVDLDLLTRYIALVCVVQCVCCLLVENVDAFMKFVDTYIIQDTVPKRVKRLYGIGCSLDSGGVRMCMAEVLIAHQLVTNKTISRKKIWLCYYIVSFFVIAIVGNMIARTTTVGLLLAAGYYFVTMGLSKRGRLSARQMKVNSYIIISMLIAVAVSIYLYNNNGDVHNKLRFAFEAFFNYAETGEFRTGSTDRLNEVMWVWPWSMRGWLIGYGNFASAYWGRFMTDIGYCRFTLYCGLVGLSIFSAYFIYNASVVAKKFRDADIFALILASLTFIIWIKVATDIFQLYALLLCLPWENIKSHGTKAD